MYPGNLSIGVYTPTPRKFVPFTCTGIALPPLGIASDHHAGGIQVAKIDCQIFSFIIRQTRSKQQHGTTKINGEIRCTAAQD